VGLFGSKEALHLEEPGQIGVAEHVREHIPDLGEYFLDFLGAFGSKRVAPHVDALRGENGCIPTGALDQFGFKKLSNGPLTFLNMMVSYDQIHISVWAGFGLRGGPKRTVESTVSRLLREQGHAAAATWAIIARPEARLDLEFLAESLTGGWDKGVATIRNGDVIKAFKKWDGGN